jgi:hypothetical protein
MRRFLAVLALGAVLPLAAASRVWASEKVDYQPPTSREVTQTATAPDTGEAGSGVVAGQGSPQYVGPYVEQHLDNMGQ